MDNEKINQTKKQVKEKIQGNKNSNIKDTNRNIGNGKKQNSIINRSIFRGLFHKTRIRVKGPNDDFIMSPKVDFAFKELMKNDIVRIGFLSAMLDIPPETIKSTKLLDTHLRKQYEDDKLGILDVRICMNDNTEIDIEIQIVKMDEWADRSIFYLSKMYTEHVKKGKKYGTAHKCICINVLDFVLFPEHEGYYSGFHIWEDNRREQYTDKIELHVIELPKLKKINIDLSAKEETEDLRALWGQFINAKNKEEFAMIARKNNFINAAFEHLKLISFSERKRREYDARERMRMDHDAYMRQRERERQKLEKERKEVRKMREEVEGEMAEVKGKVKELKEKDEELKEKDEELKEKDEELKEKDEELKERDEELKEKEKKLKEKAREIEELKRQLETK